MSIKTWQERLMRPIAHMDEHKLECAIAEIDELRTALAAAEAKIKAMDEQEPVASISWCDVNGADKCDCSVTGPCKRSIDVYLAAGAKP